MKKNLATVTGVKSAQADAHTTAGGATLDTLIDPMPPKTIKGNITENSIMTGKIDIAGVKTSDKSTGSKRSKTAEGETEQTPTKRFLKQQMRNYRWPEQEIRR